MYTDKRQSLIERKQQQWAREREELAGLNALWGRESQFLRARNGTKFQNTNDVLLRESNIRRQSLPPLQRNQNISYTSHEKLDKEMGGETSGYGSDNANNSPEHYQQTPWNHALGYESSSSGREDRLKWGDRGVHVGKFWEPKEVDNFGKTSDTPGWVKRGLETATQVIVSNTSPAESPEQDYGDRDRPCTSSTSSNMRCFIRGQNVPIEPTELAEREKRRQLALAHQEAIRQQLEEREQKRKQEREKQIREEYEEELRIQREKEIERQRKEHEQRQIREKLEREKKRKEALQEAITLAEKQAKQEKMKQRILKQNNINIKENLIDKEKIKSSKISEENVNSNIIDNVKPIQQNLDEGSKVYIETNEQQIKNNNINNNYKNNANYNSIKSENNNLNSTDYDNLDTNIDTNIIPESREPILNNNSGNNNNNNCNNNNNRTHIPPLQLPQSNTQTDNLALVLQTPYETFQNMQFAVLMPTAGSGPATTLPIAVPLTLATDRSNTSRTENRILTPSQYRNKKFCDSSTQTDCLEYIKKENVENNRDKYIREKMAHLELNYENRSRKERRIRTDDRTRENTEERPKWGVNRPPTRYMKQSEKDPLYQRRKLRQKLRQVKPYDEKCNNYSPHSSDDSQTASPRIYRKTVYPEKRHGRALWRKNEQLFAQNVRLYQTEIVPLESDKDQIYYKNKTCHHCCCRCPDDRHKYSDKFKEIDILKIEHSSPRECCEFKNETRKNRLPDCVNNNSMDSSSEVLEKLNTLQTGEEFNRDHWGNSPRSLSLCSPRRNSEN